MTNKWITREKCSVCRGEEKEVLVTLPFNQGELLDFIQQYYEGRIELEALDGAFYTLVRCKNCDFVWQEEVLDDFGMAKLYGEWISPEKSWRKKRRMSSAYFSGICHQASLVPIIVGTSNPSSIRALDYGAGWGVWAKSALAAGMQVAAIEISEPRIAHLQSQGIPTKRSLWSADQDYDFINLEQVLEHVPEPASLLGDLKSKLTPAGFMRVAVPEGRKFLNSKNKRSWSSFNSVHPLEHINSFTKTNIVQLAEACGLEKVPDMTVLGWNLRSMVYANGSMVNIAKSLRNAVSGSVVFLRCR